MKAEKVIFSALDYFEKNLVPGMNDLQEIVFCFAKEAVVEESAAVVDAIRSNLLARVIASVDKDGNVNTEKLYGRLKKCFGLKGKIEFNLPLYGPIRLLPEDIDNIFSTLEEE